MQILHVCLSRSFSGLEQYALELAADQKNRGRSVGFAVCKGSALEKACEERGLATVIVDPYAPLGIFRDWPKFLSVLRFENDLKVIHLHSTKEVLDLALPLWFAKLGLTRNKPKVILQTHLWINHRKRDLYHKFLYTVVDELWCSSFAAKQSLAENIPVPAEKIKIVNYGRNIDKLERNFLNRENARSFLKIPSDAVVIGTVSRLEESKGVREMLEASRELLESNNKVHVVVIGGASPSDESAARYAQDLEKWRFQLARDIASRVHLCGPVSDSYKVLKAFDLYVLPSYQETFSLALLDAQLAGLPVVGSQSGGTPDVVREGRTGWLFRPRDTNSLAQKLKEALQQQNLWPQFGAEASSVVKRDFDQKNVFEKILNAYESRP